MQGYCGQDRAIFRVSAPYPYLYTRRTTPNDIGVAGINGTSPTKAQPQSLPAANSDAGAHADGQRAGAEQAGAEGDDQRRDRRESGTGGDRGERSATRRASREGGGPGASG